MAPYGKLAWGFACCCKRRPGGLRGCLLCLAGLGCIRGELAAVHRRAEGPLHEPQHCSSCCGTSAHSG